MAILLLGKSQCSICNKVLYEPENIYMFTHFVPKDHYLWEFSDSSMHRDCFNDWEHKNEFLELYQSIIGESYF